MYKLICMTFDGDYVTERADFDTIAQAWDHCNDMGNRWHFYPFAFVVKGQSIADVPDGIVYMSDKKSVIDTLKGKRVKTVQGIFARVSKMPEMANADAEQFILQIADDLKGG